jgi:hypothetical protein
MIATALRRSLVQSLAIGLACAASVMASVATSAPPTRPHAVPMESAASKSTTLTCTGGALPFNGQCYSPALISGVKTTAYGVGQRVVLQNVSVTAKTSTTVTVEGLEPFPCPPGDFCGSLMVTQTLTMSWSKGQPPVPSVVHVFGTTISGNGTTISGNLTPVGYQPAPGCYIDLC